MSSITYSERIKIETFCELGLSNIQMGVRINFTIYLVSKTMLYFHKVVNSSKILEEFSLARRKEGRSDTKKVT
ncbi:hypothetical protein EFP25_13710 [Lactiplantibacillus pentosus]|nr:hypothetical protein [Lactiplantibacillus pentosus]MCT3304526.1 hypothetical protein [Lactiplantibacillus pentosus]